MMRLLIRSNFQVSRAKLTKEVNNSGAPNEISIFDYFIIFTIILKFTIQPLELSSAFTFHLLKLFNQQRKKSVTLLLRLFKYLLFCTKERI